jgi:hypothetical protein
MSATRGRNSDSESTPNLHNYLNTHKPQGVSLLSRLELDQCVQLIIFNVQGFSTAQIWMELQASLGDMSRAIVKVKLVMGLNRNPHADVWVQQELGAALVAIICQQTKTRL